MYMYMCVCEGGFISLNTGWRVSCLKWSSETDGFKALWRHTGYINEGASGIGSNSLINPVNLPLPLYFYTLHKHIRKSLFLSFFFFLLICPWSECNLGMHEYQFYLGLRVGGRYSITDLGGIGGQSSHHCSSHPGGVNEILPL